MAMFTSQRVNASLTVHLKGGFNLSSTHPNKFSALLSSFPSSIELFLPPFLPFFGPSSFETLSANQRAPLPLSYFHIARIITKYEAAVAAAEADGGKRPNGGRPRGSPPVGWGGKGGRAERSDRRERDDCGWSVVEKYDLIRRLRARAAEDCFRQSGFWLWCFNFQAVTFTSLMGECF